MGLLCCVFSRVFLIITICFHCFGPPRRARISWVHPRSFKLLFLSFLWLFCSLYPFVMWCTSVAVAREITIKRIQLEIWAVLIFPRARDWFDLFVRFTPQYYSYPPAFARTKPIFDDPEFCITTDKTIVSGLVFLCFGSFCWLHVEPKNGISLNFDTVNHATLHMTIWDSCVPM